VMTQDRPRSSFGYGTEIFKCLECGGTGEATEWKFCAFCGAEIVRFDRPQENETNVAMLKFKIFRYRDSPRR